MKFTYRKNFAAALLLLAPMGAALVAQPSAAQHAPYRAEAGTGSIRAMALNSDAGLQPGATLRLQVYATPGARWANATLGDTGIRVPLRERSPGEYVGTHVIRRGERIDPTRLMTVRAGWGSGPVAVAFNYPPSFQALAMGAGPESVGPPEVTSFSVSAGEDLEPGDVVRFRVEGTPRARVWVNVPELVRALPLREVRPGVYVGRYIVRDGDDTDAFSDARAVLRSGNQRAVAHANTSDDRSDYGYGYGR